MKVKNIITYTLCTLLASMLAYYSVGFFDFITCGFIVSGIICAITGITNLYLGAISSLICIIISYVSSGIEGIILYTFVVISGLVSGVFVKNKCDTIRLILINSAGCLLSCVVYIAFVSSVSGANAIETYINHIKPEFIEIMNEYFIAAGLNDYTAVVNEFAETYFVYVQNMMPSIFVIIALMFSFVSAIIVSVILKISREEKLFKVEFSKFICDRTSTVVFFISGICSLLMNDGVFQTVFMNIFVILLFVFQVCGFSIMDYYLKTKRIPSGFRALIILLGGLFATSGILLLILIIVSIMDSFKNFRNIGIDTDVNDKGCE